MAKTFTDVLGFENNVYSTKKFKATPLVNSSKNSFINAISNKTSTENGALTNISTQSAIADWFYHAAAMRKEANKNRILNLFVNAFNADKTQALRILFYVRDIRGGQGERNVFRTCLEYLGNAEKDWVIKNLNLIAEYGRYDDYLVLLKTSCKDEVINFIGEQLEKDLVHHVKGELTSISLLAKWMPSENASSKDTKTYAKILLNTGKFGAASSYRKALTLLRKDLEIVENKLRVKEYSEIDYSKLPSYAALKYRKAFSRNDAERYCQYIQDTKAGKVVNGKKVKINTATLYPYDLVKKYSNGYYISGPIDETVEAQWRALPAYVPEINGIVVNDTSGSMTGLPMQVSLSLAVYIAEHNKSEVWKNYVIPFSSQAHFMQVKGETLLDKIKSVHTGDCSNTNLQSVFDLILDRAKASNVPDSDMPKTLLIISDMEFNPVMNNFTNHEVIKKKYAKAGYTLPKMVWWNVDSRNNQTPITVNDKGNILLSGCSPAVMKVALGGDYDVMEAILKVIEQERYAIINY